MAHFEREQAFRNVEKEGFGVDRGKKPRRKKERGGKRPSNFGAFVHRARKMGALNHHAYKKRGCFKEEGEKKVRTRKTRVE